MAAADRSNGAPASAAPTDRITKQTLGPRAPRSDAGRRPVAIVRASGIGDVSSRSLIALSGSTGAQKNKFSAFYTDKPAPPGIPLQNKHRKERALGKLTPGSPGSPVSVLAGGWSAVSGRLTVEPVRDVKVPAGPGPLQSELPSETANSGELAVLFKLGRDPGCGVRLSGCEYPDGASSDGADGPTSSV